MINPLRRKHRKVWQLLALLIPVLFVIVLAKTPSSPFGSTKGSEENPKVELVNGALSIIIHYPLRSAYTEVFVKSGANCDTETFLGQLQAVGSYSFELEDGFKPCEVYFIDQLNQKIFFNSEIE